MADPGLHVVCAVGLVAAGIDDDDAVRQLAHASDLEPLPADIEARLAAMDLEPTVRDRALLLLEQTRMLAERAEEHAADSDRLRSVAAAQGDSLHSVRRATADARDDVLLQREATADARDDTLAQREATSDARHAALEQSSEQAFPDALDQAAHQWVGHALHELRQPLAVIGGAVEALHAHEGELSPQTQRKMVGMVRRQTMLLQHVVRQLAQAQQLDDGLLEVHPQQVDVQLLVTQLLDDYRPLLGEVAVTHARTGRAVVACVEPAAAVEILLVLVRNAVDHAPGGGQILLETVPDATTVRISVHDDGPGVSPADRDRIFDYGTRLDDAGSLGLGLFIARRLARAHGGDITVEGSHILSGARFDLILPTGCADHPGS